ncbi:MAG: FAD-dependent monooxygenase [Pseudomonadota bacterium]
MRDKVEALGAPLERLLGKSQPSGRVVLDARYDIVYGTRHGLAMQRRALFETLLDIARDAGADVRFGLEVTSADGATGWVTTATGEDFEADLVVDALGSRSPLCPRPGRELSYGALWGMFAWPDDECVFSRTRLEQRYYRASNMAGVLPLGRSATDPTFRAAYFWSIPTAKMAAWRAAPIEDWKAEAQTLWPETAPLLSQIRTHNDLIEARYLHRTLPNPVAGRLVHMGDSWHASSPQLGQGANMGLLDAASLALALRQGPNLAEASRDFHGRRRWHLAIYQAASRIFTPVYQSDSRLLPWVRDQLLSRVSYGWPASALISAMVAGTMGYPLRQLDLE